MEGELNAFLSGSCGTALQILTTCILPFFQITAIIMDIFNATIFAKWKNPLYRYLSANATVDTIWILLYFAFTQIVCKNNPNFILTFQAQVFLLFILYMIRVVNMISSLINTQIAFDRYFILTKGYIKKSIKTRLLIFFLISSAFYVPFIFLFTIYRVEICQNCTDSASQNVTQYYYFAHYSEFFQKHLLSKQILASMNFMSTLIFLVMMIVLNSLLYKNFKHTEVNKAIKLKTYHINDENNPFQPSIITTEQLNNTRMTLMVFWILCLFIFNQLLTVIVPSLVFLSFNDGFRLHLRSFVLFLLFRPISSILNTIFYCIYYNKYRQVLKSNLIILVGVLIFVPCFITAILALHSYFTFLQKKNYVFIIKG